jgi:chaperone protein EcpD
MFRNIFCISLLAALIACQAQASIVMNNTRVIYNARDREVTVPISNRSSKPVLVQSWIDNGDTQADPSTVQTPFIILPPVTRVDGNSAKTLRLRAVDIAALPSDRESVFWLNVLDVPAKLPGNNLSRLQVALQSRVKLFYRPPGLRGSPRTAVSALIWHSKAGSVSVSNPGARYVSLLSVATKTESLPVDMIAPGESKEIPLTIKSGMSFQVSWIDDNGATQIYNAVTK